MSKKLFHYTQVVSAVKILRDGASKTLEVTVKTGANWYDVEALEEE